MGQSKSTPVASVAPVAPVPIPLTSCPWRQPSEWNAQLEQSLISEIQNLHPQKRPNLLMVGPVGAGKSSFINSILSIGKGQKCGIAVTGISTTSYTVNLNQYTENSLLKRYRLMDCMGIEALHGKGLQADDINPLLKGHVKTGYSFNPAKPISEEDDSFWNTSPRFKDQIHCVVFVMSSKSIYFDMPQEVVRKISEIQDKIRRAYIPRVLILTQVDLLCDEVRRDISKMFWSVKVKQAVDTASFVFNIDKASIHPVKNYEVDITVDPLTNIPLLLALRQAMQYAEEKVDHVLHVDSDDSD